MTDDTAARIVAQLAAAGVPGFNGQHPEDETAHRVEQLRGRLHTGTAVCAIPPPAALVDGLLFTPGESFSYSPPKLGKTFFAIDLAGSVATGRPFMGRPVTAGPVLYVVAEGVGGIGARVAAWCDYHRVDNIDQAHFLTTAVNLTDRGAVTALAQLTHELETRLVVLDTLARCTVGADENSARDMGLVVEALDMLRDTTGHVHTVHHAGKDDSRGMRGSTALLGAADTVIQLQGNSDGFQVKVTDQKDAEPATPWWCRITPHDRSAVITPMTDLELATGVQRVVLDALEALPPEDRTSSRWAEMAENNDVSRRRFFETKKALLESGVVIGGGGRGAL